MSSTSEWAGSDAEGTNLSGSSQRSVDSQSTNSLVDFINDSDALGETQSLDSSEDDSLYRGRARQKIGSNRYPLEQLKIAIYRSLELQDTIIRLSKACRFDAADHPCGYMDSISAISFAAKRLLRVQNSMILGIEKAAGRREKYFGPESGGGAPILDNRDGQDDGD
ncbi:uncharacterized protein F5Z01DRAFT_668419 [Emericellopsis atlantica]|uniref:Uncharacterized protein n=1 Tax=Emericellopsis atlantica TaxID=2614577 RepID=A0A9P7ZCP6_9HYPO|nr:uncharacterized protein F5Z01DRAFT_668419 [Emericellopsis atlantica]KAG9249669.1 hypothetical protein F5Z01DRAFT_668419 [Emericellopsis atlantica]